MKISCTLCIILYMEIYFHIFNFNMKTENMKINMKTENFSYIINENMKINMKTENLLSKHIALLSNYIDCY